MSPALAGRLVLGAHLAVIAFNVAGLIVIPLGAWLDWAFVRWRWLRLLHLASLGIVALQAAFGRACILTIWQGELTGGGREDPLIMRWINSLIFWPLPIWVFTAAYLAVFAYVVALWWWAPTSPAKRGRGTARRAARRASGGGGEPTHCRTPPPPPLRGPPPP